MRNMTPLPVLGVLALLFGGCLREELPVPRPASPGGAAYTAALCVGGNYGDQVWFDLGTNTEVSRNQKTAWDLAFESAGGGWRIRLNGANFAKAKATGQFDITVPTDTTGYGPGWTIDRPSGHADSTAIGDRRTGQEVVVINLGYTIIGLPAGLRKLQVMDVDASGYTIRIARLNGSGMVEVHVPRDPERRYVHFRMSTAQVVTIAPPDGTYDLVMTQYTNQFYEPFTPYQVTGAINGFSGMRVAELRAPDLGSVSLDDTLAHPFSTREDAIGYDWKTYVGPLYVVHVDHVFIVQTADGAFYKARFIDFYDEGGVRGCPKMEVVAF